MDEEDKDVSAPDGMPHHDLMELFEEMSWRERLRRTIKGLGAPKDSGDYKFARLQILRLWAPFSAIAVPLVAVILLAIFSVMKTDKDRAIDVQVVEPDKLEDKLEDIKELPPPEVEPQPTETEMPPDPNMPQDRPPAPQEPFSPKPVKMDAVAITKSPVVMKGIFANRNPGARGGALSGGGGGSRTEAAVLLALRWLKKYQEPDGSWNSASGGSGMEHNGAAPALTGLALLAYLAHGETPASEEFGPTVEMAIKWLIANQAPGGRFPKMNDGNEYGHPIAAYALCEAYTMTKIPMLKDAAQKSIDVIIQGQTAGLLWDYKCVKASSRNDISYSGWCMQALKAAALAGLENAGLKECMVSAIQGTKQSFLARPDGTGDFDYARQTGRPPTTANRNLTGVGVLCLQLLGAGKSEQSRGGLQSIQTVTFSWEKPWYDHAPIYGWYYITQARFHEGGPSWTAWNNQFSPTLCRTINVIPKAIKDPKGNLVDIGYWKSASPKEYSQSYTYNTTLCALMLEVYYRYLPSYKPPEETATEETFADKQGDINVDIK